MVSVRDLRKSYGAIEAVRAISFDVERGEIFGLLGPNGAGKTTTVEILEGLRHADAGTAIVAGIDVTRDPRAVKERIGVQLQASAFPLHLTAREVVDLFAICYDRDVDAVALLREVELADRARQLNETLSGGQRQRLSIATALVNEPAVLFLDEPTTGLDPGARRDLWSYLTRWRDSEGVTILVTTHIMEEAEGCDRLAILDRGRLVAIGTPAQLKQQVGGDVITLKTRDPESLRQALRRQFGMEPALLNGTLRIEHPRGHELVGQLIEAFADQLESVTLGKPSLEDVFIHHTGRRFSEAQESTP